MKIKIDLEALIIKIRIGSNKIISLFSFPKKVFRVLTLYRHIGGRRLIWLKWTRGISIIIMRDSDLVFFQTTTSKHSLEKKYFLLISLARTTRGRIEVSICWPEKWWPKRTQLLLNVFGIITKLFLCMFNGTDRVKPGNNSSGLEVVTLFSSCCLSLSTFLD